MTTLLPLLGKFPMKSIGIRQFRDNASMYLTSKEILAVKKHGKLIGFYLPVIESESEEIQKALTKLSLAVEKALTETGWDEEKLSQAFDLSQKDQECV